MWYNKHHAEGRAARQTTQRLRTASLNKELPESMTSLAQELPASNPGRLYLDSTQSDLIVCVAALDWMRQGLWGLTAPNPEADQIARTIDRMHCL